MCLPTRFPLRYNPPRPPEKRRGETGHWLHPGYIQVTSAHASKCTLHAGTTRGRPTRDAGFSGGGKNSKRKLENRSATPMEVWRSPEPNASAVRSCERSKITCAVQLSCVLCSVFCVLCSMFCVLCSLFSAPYNVLSILCSLFCLDYLVLVPLC